VACYGDSGLALPRPGCGFIHLTSDRIWQSWRHEKLKASEDERLAPHVLDERTGAWRTSAPHFVIALAAFFWAASDLGFYYFLPAIGADFNFDTRPIESSMYYLCWVLIAALLLRRGLDDWIRSSAAPRRQNLSATAAALCASFLLCAAFAIVILPQLPSVAVSASPETQVYKMATSIFFLPKSIEIIFQQMLFFAVVVALSACGLSLARISSYSALLFGGAHSLLALDGSGFAYVASFMASATAFGALFPFLILRVPLGLPIAYSVHWMFYAAVSGVLRLTGG
jgi:hypothetical protein